MNGSREAVLQTFVDGGLLPGEDGLPQDLDAGDLSSDLLPLLMRAWELVDAEAAHAPRRRPPACPNRLQELHARGVRLTLGVPSRVARGTHRWLGTRLAWWPQGIPSGRLVGLVSSRLGTAPDAEESWFTVLRAACAKIDPSEDLLLTATATTTGEFVVRSARLFGLRTLRMDVAEEGSLSLGKWFDRVSSVGPADNGTHAHHVFLSPPLAVDGDGIDESVRPVPARDRAVVALSDRLLAFRVRRGGHVHQAIRARLGDSDWPPASVYIALGPKLVQTEVAAELMDAGAVGWVVLDALPRNTTTSRQGPTTAARRDSGVAAARPRTSRNPPTSPQHVEQVSIVAFPPAESWSFLTHCTRRRQGPWPDQGDAEYLDDLILARRDADHSALAALERIVRQRRLIATAETIRGATPVVSFTAVPLAELQRLRVFRPHRGRWDFEPYGICICRDELAQLGARSVHYGDDRLWESLSPEERPFFQLRQTRGAAGAQAVDWKVEDEWRVVGDVDLAVIPAESALVFVPTEPEARHLAAISPWPVTVVNGLPIAD